MIKKLLSWDGVNKGQVRLEKAELALKCYTRDSSVISLPGAKAKFEKLLKEGGVPPEKILGAQTVYNSPYHRGEEIFESLLKVRNGSLTGMNIWPGDILDLFKRIRRGRIQIRKLPRKVSEYLTTYPVPTKVSETSIIDLDMCGIFSKHLLDTIEQIFKSKITTDKFLLFVNIQKGRDVRGGKLFDLLADYNVYDTDLDTIRFYWFPYVIISIGSKYGYFGKSPNLWEYSDKNESNVGVNMLQYAFLFNKTSKRIPPPLRRAGYYTYDFVKADA